MAKRSLLLAALLPRCLRALAGVALLASLAAPQDSRGQACPHRGDLDTRYCDADRDLLADSPRERARQRDPATLLFSYTPADDPSIYEGKFTELIAHLSRVTGKPVRWAPAESYPAQVDAMRAGRLHVAGLGGTSAPYVVNLAGFVPLVAIERHDGTTGYSVQLVTARASTVESLNDVRGRHIAHVSPTSWSGDVAPRLLMKAAGLTPGQDYIVRYSGKHENSVIGVLKRDFEAALVASTVVERMLKRGQIEPQSLRVVHAWQPFPRTAFGVSYDLDPTLRERIRKAFLSFDFQASPLAGEFKDAKGFASIDYRRDWADLRMIQKGEGIAYTPDDLARLRR